VQVYDEVPSTWFFAYIRHVLDITDTTNS